MVEKEGLAETNPKETQQKNEIISVAFGLRCNTVVIVYEWIVTMVGIFDARDVREGSHRSSNSSFDGRANFFPNRAPAMLEILQTKPTDSGIYRCRVDFHKSPTRNTRVQLTIIEID
uniref:Ig-like domain-containing protein n=1 Tax=Anopheles christyi TaxID=43041 RepID=A0A182JRM9_9DIPT